MHLCVLGGIAARIAASGRSPGWAALTGLGAGVLGAFAVMTWSEQSEARRRRVPGWENRLLDGVLSPLSTRDWYVFMVAFALARQLEWLVPAAAVGAQVFWVAGLGVAHGPMIVSGLGRVQGDLGDPRLHHYMLEHGFRLGGQAPVCRDELHDR